MGRPLWLIVAACGYYPQEGDKALLQRRKEISRKWQREAIRADRERRHKALRMEALRDKHGLIF